VVLIKEKKATFDTLVKTMSDDRGSISKGGDYGWWNEDAQWVEPFKMAGLTGTKGNISVVETMFGYHIIEVMDVSKTRHPSYRVAQLFKPITPSDETNQKIFAQANQFGGENNSAELFDKAVETNKLTKRLADDVKEGDRQLPGGLDRARDLVKWMYSANIGEVSVFAFSDKYVVAKLSNIKNKGVLPLESVKADVTKDLIKQKKADMFIEEFRNKAGNSTNVDEIAAKMGMESKKQENMSMVDVMIAGLGPDGILVGTASGLKAGATSKATMGETGVFIVNVTKLTPAPAVTDIKALQAKVERELASRSDYDAFNALKETADIEDHKARVD
jgi:peptidyl-prolyl cis-trans isomerase D